MDINYLIYGRVATTKGREWHTLFVNYCLSSMSATKSKRTTIFICQISAQSRGNFLHIQFRRTFFLYSQSITHENSSTWAVNGHRLTALWMELAYYRHVRRRSFHCHWIENLAHEQHNTTSIRRFYCRDRLLSIQIDVNGLHCVLFFTKNAQTFMIRTKKTMDTCGEMNLG